MHSMLSHVDLAEALEEGKQGNIQPLVGSLPVSLLVKARVADRNQAKHPHAQVPVQQFLQTGQHDRSFHSSGLTRQLSHF